MTEVQRHGFIFEEWIKSILGVEHLACNYTQKWDITGEIPISVKCMGLTNALEFGSTVRMWEIDEPFSLVIGRWEQVGNTKVIRSIDEITVIFNHLAQMRGQITLEEIKEFDQMIKQFPPGLVGQAEGIAFAEEWKRERSNRMGLLTITHKIDSKNQRRIQCNLNFSNYVKLFGELSMKTVFRGHEFTDIIAHGPRTFNH
jgi:hypothetical protein